MLLLTPACSRATDRRVPGRVVAPAVGERHDARHHLVGHLDGHLDACRPRELTRAVPPSARPRRPASSGWTSSVQRSLPFTSTFDVVHPAVLRAEVAAADEHHAARRGGRGGPARRGRSATT